jgi:DNA-binding response OmpR family regulator
MTEPQQVILIVDDDPDLRTLVTTILENQGYSMLEAGDGLDAIALLERGPAPNLIITDVDMPRMDGWELVRTVRARPATAMTPVIFLSVHDTSADRVLGYRLGADDYLPKPIQFDELKIRVRNVLRRARVSSSGWRAQGKAGGIHGTLADLGLCPLLVMLAMERKTGTLKVERGGDTARLAVREGRVLRAHFDAASLPRGIACVHTLLRWPDGAFHFTIEAVDGADEIKMSTDHLVMEAARLLDETGKRSG